MFCALFLSPGQQENTPLLGGLGARMRIQWWRLSALWFDQVSNSPLFGRQDDVGAAFLFLCTSEAKADILSDNLSNKTEDIEIISGASG